MSSSERLPDEIWNTAVVDVIPGVTKIAAVEALMKMGENVKDEMSAWQLLKTLPKQVQVKGANLGEFKAMFETVEWFHHERVISDCKGGVISSMSVVDLPPDP